PIFERPSISSAGRARRGAERAHAEAGRRSVAGQPHRRRGSALSLGAALLAGEVPAHLGDPACAVAAGRRTGTAAATGAGGACGVALEGGGGLGSAGVGYPDGMATAAAAAWSTPAACAAIAALAAIGRGSDPRLRAA